MAKDPVVQRMQAMLTALGMDCGDIDGVRKRRDGALSDTDCGIQDFLTLIADSSPEACARIDDFQTISEADVLRMGRALTIARIHELNDKGLGKLSTAEIYQLQCGLHSLGIPCGPLNKDLAKQTRDGVYSFLRQNPRPASLPEPAAVKGIPVSSPPVIAPAFAKAAAPSTGSIEYDARALFNQGIRNYTHECLNRDVRYKFTNGPTAQADSKSLSCSGFSSHALRRGVDETQNNSLYGGIQIAFPEEVPGLLTTASGWQIANLESGKYSSVIRNPTIEKLKPGMVLGLDTGNTNHDHTKRDIDHVAVVYAEEDGRLMIAESVSGRGVITTPAQIWLDESYGRKQRGRGNEKWEVYAADAFGAASMVIPDNYVTPKMQEPQEEYIIPCIDNVECITIPLVPVASMEPAPRLPASFKIF